MATTQASALQASAAVHVAAGEARDLLTRALRDALAARAAVADLVALVQPVGDELADLAHLVAEDLDAHDHGGREAHLKVALEDLMELLDRLGHTSKPDDVATFNVDDCLLDVTVASDDEEITIFIDSTPRRPLRVIVDEVEAA
jgi:hypothetical protein